MKASAYKTHLFQALLLRACTPLTCRSPDRATNSFKLPFKIHQKSASSCPTDGHDILQNLRNKGSPCLHSPPYICSVGRAGSTCQTAGAKLLCRTRSYSPCQNPIPRHSSLKNVLSVTSSSSPLDALCSEKSFSSRASS